MLALESSDGFRLDPALIHRDAVQMHAGGLKHMDRVQVRGILHQHGGAVMQQSQRDQL